MTLKATDVRHQRASGGSAFVSGWEVGHVALVVSSGVLLGFVLMNILPVIEAWPSNPVEYPAAYLSLVLSNANSGTLFVFFIVSALAASSLRSAPSVGIPAINAIQASRNLLLLAALGLTIPVLPIRLFVLLAAAIALLARPPAAKPQSRVFWVAFLMWLSLIAIGSAQGLLGIDSVRARIPVQMQIAGIFPYLTVFMTAFCIQRTSWKLKDFERFFAVIMVGGVVLSFEALATFYAGRESVLPFMSTSLYQSQMFAGVLVQHHHFVARIALITIFMAIYFFETRAHYGYLLVAALAGLLLFATLDRAPILSAILGLGAWLTVPGARRRTRGATMLGRVGALAVIVVALIAAAGALNTISAARDANTVQTSLQNRGLRLARSVDAFAYTPWVGTGPLLETYYLGSSYVPPDILFWAADRFGVSRAYAVGRVSRSDFTLDLPGTTTHNLWVEFVLHWGIAGICAVLIWSYAGVHAFRRLWRASTVLPRAAWVPFFMAASLSLSMQTTVKFRYYWLFLVVFLFVGRAVREFIDDETV